MTDIFKLTCDYEFGEIYFKNCRKTGMQAIIAIHSTKLGPALGGCRFVSYESTEKAIIDALRLGQGMSYKAAMANLPLGGGKAVIIKPQHEFSREAYMLSFGEFVESINGRYITALDSGTELSDMDIISTQTSFLASRSEYYGDPSPHTVDGVIEGIKAACFAKYGSHTLSDLTMAVQGLGHVGYGVAKILTEQGVKLFITDVDEHKTDLISQELKQTKVSPSQIHAQTCHVFVPCALGGIINPQTIHELKCDIIAGAANNQLLNEQMAHTLHQKNIFYVPDYIINAGGLIFAAGRYLQHSDSAIEKGIQEIYHRVVDVYNRSQNENVPPSIIIDLIAKAKVSDQA